MKWNGNAKDIYQAFRFISGNYTKKQLNEGIHLVIEATEETVSLISVEKNAYYQSEIKEAMVEQPGVWQVEVQFVEALADRLKSKEWTVSSQDESLLAISEDERIEGAGDEVEFAIDLPKPIATLPQANLAAMLTELLSGALKSARDFTDTLLLRLRKNQLNGRSINMQAIVVSSTPVETDNQGLIDMYLEKTQAQAFNKSIKLMNKKAGLSLLKGDDQVGITADGNTCILLGETIPVGMPDITQLMKRCASLSKEDASKIDVALWKAELMAVQKETDEADKEHLKYGVRDDGHLIPLTENPKAIIDVKTTLKLLKAIKEKELVLHFLNPALVLHYEADERIHYSVLMTGKEQ